MDIGERGADSVASLGKRYRGGPDINTHVETEWSDESVRRVVALTLVVATILLLVSDVLFDAVRYRHGSLIPRAADFVTVGAGKAGLFRWAGITDLLGDYLLLIPAALYLWRAAPNTRWILADVASLSGVGLAIVGGAGAAVLAVAGAPLITAYATAPSTSRPMIALAFATLNEVVTGGVWQTFVALLGAVWFVGLFVLLRRHRRWFAVYSAVLGVAFLFGSIGHMIGIRYEGGVPDTVVFLPINIWIAWLAVLLWRGAPFG